MLVSPSSGGLEYGVECTSRRCGTGLVQRNKLSLTHMVCKAAKLDEITRMGCEFKYRRFRFACWGTLGWRKGGKGRTNEGENEKTWK